MMSRRSFSMVCAAGFAAFLGTAVLTTLASGRPQEARTTALSALDALPGDTTLLVRVRSWSDVQRKFKASPLYALREHPDMKRFLDNIQKKMVEGMADARAKLGFDPLEIVDSIEGEVVIALGGLDKLAAALSAQISGMGGDPDFGPKDMPFLVMANAGGSAPKLREKLAKIYDFAIKEGAKKDVEQFRGGQITTLTHQKGADKKEKADKGDLEKVYFGDLGSMVLLGINRPYLEQTMANLTTPSPDALTKSADFVATQQQVRPDSDVMFFLNLKTVMIAARKNLQNNPMGAMIWQIVEGKILGRSLKNLGFSGSLRESGIETVTFVNNAGGSDGLLGILRGPSLPGRPNAIIPDDVDSFLSLAINMPVLYGIIKDIAKMAMPLMGGGAGPGAEMPDPEQLIESMYQIKVKAVIEALGSGFHYYQRGGLSQQNPMGNVTVALELKDEMPVKELLGKLSMMAGLQPQRYMDRDLYLLGGANGGEEGAAVGIADKFLVAGIKAESVKEVIRRAGKGGKSLADNPTYQNIAGAVPQQVSMLDYSSPKAFREVLKMVKDGLAAAGEDMPVPDLTAVADVMAGSIGYSVWKEQGFFCQSMTPYKKK